MFTNLQFIFIKDFNQINREQFRESLKGKKKKSLSIPFSLKETNFTGPTSFVWLARKKHIIL